MAGATKKASAVWEGDLMSGHGQVSAASSGVFKDVGLTWKARTSDEPKTSPEELLAAAHAACFAMALSHGLAGGGKPAKKLEVSATVTFEQVTGGFKVKSSALEVRGTVPGMDQAAFQSAAEKAKDGCPISGAIKGNVELSVKATLA